MASRSMLFVAMAFAAFCLAYPSETIAGGSISWDEVRTRVNAEDPFLAAFITERLELSPVGGAVRVGHDSEGKSTVPGLEAGARLPPYEFYAKPKGADGGYTLSVTLEPVSFDGGKTFAWQISIRKKRSTD